jgi:hypothetical protein
MRVFRSAGVTPIMSLLYPRLLAIHDLAEDVGFPGANGRLKLPRFMRASYGWMVAEGGYLMSEWRAAAWRAVFVLISSQRRDRDDLAGWGREPADRRRLVGHGQRGGA